MFAGLASLGFRVLLLARGTLGGQQTSWSQGIIHSGIKYAATPESETLAATLNPMTGIWRSCLSGSGQLDLRRVEVLSDRMYLWTQGEESLELKTYLAWLESQQLATQLPRSDYPEAFTKEAVSGVLLKIPETVIDTPSLLAALIGNSLQYTATLSAETACRFQQTSHGMLVCIGQNISLHARRLVFAAGGGNVALMNRAGYRIPEPQLRPLHQVLLRLPGRHRLYGHYLDDTFRAGPAMTVTTRQSGPYSLIHLGGGLAEAGVGRSRREQARAAEKLVGEALPRLDLTRAEWFTQVINRVEPTLTGGRRPADICLEQHGHCFLFWPIKLTLVPLAVDRLANSLGAPGTDTAGGPPTLQQPGLAIPPDEACRDWMRL